MGAEDSLIKRIVKRRWLILAITLVIIFGMLAGTLAKPVVAQRPSCDTSYTTVDFISETCLDTYCTWEYQVCQRGFALSHWVLGLCDCFESHIIEVGYIDDRGNKTVLSECTEGQMTPCWDFGLDPTTGLFGLKWDSLPGPENECWTFYFTIDQDLDPNLEKLKWTSKFAACDPGGGTVTGPACPCGCSNILAFKYYDVNKNGEYDYEGHLEDNPIGDYELKGWEICLYDGNGLLIECQKTDEMGFVDFGCLSPGEYRICETPGGISWANSQPGGDPPCYTVTLDAGEQIRLHFGNYDPAPKLAYIRAGKYYDYNHDGECNGPCCPLNDWVICLDGDCKTTCDRCMLCGGCTDYWEVAEGTYILCEMPKNGWVSSDPGVEPPCKEVTVKEGEFLCVPFGNWEPDEPPAPSEGEGDEITVGGKVFPISKANILAPLIILGIIILAGGIFLIRHRVHGLGTIKAKSDRKIVKTTY